MVGDASKPGIALCCGQASCTPGQASMKHAICACIGCIWRLDLNGRLRKGQVHSTMCYASVPNPSN
eukprot:3287349-Heterocapsa_arctica.AAC.1